MTTKYVYHVCARASVMERAIYMDGIMQLDDPMQSGEELGNLKSSLAQQMGVQVPNLNIVSISDLGTVEVEEE